MFGAVKLTKNADINNYKYSRYGTGFDRKGKFSFGNGFGRNVIIFGVDMSFLNMLIIRKKHFSSWSRSIKGLDDTTLTVEKKDSFNFTEKRKDLFQFALKWIKKLFICQWCWNS